MKHKSNCFLIVAIIAMGVLFQACLKDKTLKDKGFNMHVNISPAYGIPLVNLTIEGKDIVNQINKDSATRSYFLDYDPLDYDLCVITYDKTNIPFFFPQTFKQFDTTLTYPLDFFSDLRKDGWEPRQAFLSLYVDNKYTTDFRPTIKKVEYENLLGIKQSIPIDLNKINIIQASLYGEFKRTLAIDGFIINNPMDIVFQGRELTLSFGLETTNYPDFGGSLNLNPIIKVPAYFKLNNFVRRDTTAVNLTEIANVFNDTSVANLQNVTFYLSIVNGLPLRGELQVYFVDENYRLIDSIQKQEINLLSAIPNASDFRVETPLTTTPDPITISGERFDKIKNAKYLIFKETFSSYLDPATNTPSDIKLFKSNFITILLSCKIDTHLEGDPSEISY
ncbi:MAG: hypothetical protein LBG80_18670 [Bacteroidales bacterium]|nr:hypothetical protein [Bacteroidales bacterium]